MIKIEQEQTRTNTIAAAFQFTPWLWVHHLFDSVGESFCRKIVFFSGNMIFINLFIRVFKPKKVCEFKVKIILNFEKLTLCTPCSFAHSLSMYLVEFMCVYLSHPPSASFILFLGTCRQRRRMAYKSGGVGGNNRAFLLCHTMTQKYSRLSWPLQKFSSLF